MILLLGDPTQIRFIRLPIESVLETALDGIIFDAPQGTMEFSTMVRWAVEAETIVTHRVDYKVLDEEFDLASDNMGLWYAACESLAGVTSVFQQIH